MNAGLNLICHYDFTSFGFIGDILSRVLIKDGAASKTIAIEVGMQNSGLGAVLARENFTNLKNMPSPGDIEFGAFYLWKYLCFSF